MKEADWIQYKLDAGQPQPEKLCRLSDMLQRRYQLRIADIEALKKRNDLIDKFNEYEQRIDDRIDDYANRLKNYIDKVNSLAVRGINSLNNYNLNLNLNRRSMDHPRRADLRRPRHLRTLPS